MRERESWGEWGGGGGGGGGEVESGSRERVKGGRGEGQRGRREERGGCKGGGKREWVKQRDEKQATGGEKREGERYAGRRMGRWTAGDEDNVDQTKREGEMRRRSKSEPTDGG